MEMNETAIQVNPDGRMRTALTIIKEDQQRWVNDGPSGREQFLKSAIKNRGALDALESLDYNYKEAIQTAGRDKLICRVDEETLAALKEEARVAGLDLDGYMRALTYTYAKKLQEEKRRKDKEEEEQRAVNTPTHFDIPLSKPLQAALFNKYPLTEEEERIISLDSMYRYAYLQKRLFKLIEESLEE